MVVILLNLHYYKNLSKINLYSTDYNQFQLLNFHWGKHFQLYKQKGLLHYFFHLITFSRLLHHFVLHKNIYNQVQRKSDLAKSNPIPHKEVVTMLDEWRDRFSPVTSPALLKIFSLCRILNLLVLVTHTWLSN